MKTTKTTNTNSTKVLPNNNKKKSKLPEDVQKLLEDWEEFEKNLEKKRKQEIKDLRRNRGKSMPTKGSQLNGSVHQPLQNERKKEINQNETEKPEEKVRPWKLRLNETKNSKREDYVSFYKTIKENQDKENKGENEEKKRILTFHKPKFSFGKKATKL